MIPTFDIKPVPRNRLHSEPAWLLISLDNLVAVYFDSDAAETARQIQVLLDAMFGDQPVPLTPRAATFLKENS